MDGPADVVPSEASDGTLDPVRFSVEPRVRRLDWALGRLVSRERNGAIRKLEAAWSLPAELPEETLADPLLERVRRQLAPELPSRVPWDWLALDSLTAFRRRVLRAAAGIPAGETRSYGEVARQVGSGGGARAVGQALKANPFAPLVPCHRVVRTDGTVGGYRGCPDGSIKRNLLALEGGLN